MPTSKPRITITLTDEQHKLLCTLAELQGVSMSSIVVDLFASTMPVLERLHLILKAAADAPQNVLDGLRSSLEGAEKDVRGLHATAMGQLDLLVNAATPKPSGRRSTAKALPRSGSSASPSSKEKAAARSMPAARPPTSNRGVRNSPSSLKSSTYGSAKVKGRK
jgi:uncharacterized protein (DUF1778 family)